MNILLTKNGYVLVEGVVEYLITDTLLLKCMKDANIRVQLLNALGRSALVVGRLGKQEAPSIYVNRQRKVTEAPGGSFVKEVGYYAKL